MAVESTSGFETRARRAARKICAETRTWARYLGDSVGRPDLRNAVFREVLAYALHLAETRGGVGAAACPEGFYRALRAECTALLHWWRSNPAASPKGETGDGPNAAGALLPVWRERQRRDKAAFEAFCRATGLGSEVLVGRGDNLAGLVFYIVIFGLCAEKAPLSGAQAQRLLRRLHDCRVRLGQSAPGWLEETEALLGQAPSAPRLRQIENAILL